MFSTGYPVTVPVLLMPVLFSSVELNVSVFTSFDAVRFGRCECSYCSWVRTRSGPDKQTETRCTPKQTLVRFVCGENVIRLRSALTAESPVRFWKNLAAMFITEWGSISPVTTTTTNVDKHGKSKQYDQHQNQPLQLPLHCEITCGGSLVCSFLCYMPRDFPQFWPIGEQFWI